MNYFSLQDLNNSNTNSFYIHWKYRSHNRNTETKDGQRLCLVYDEDLKTWYLTGGKT